MATFREANQARLQLKMKLSVYSWYGSSIVIPDSDGYSVIVAVKQITSEVKKLVSPVLGNVGIRIEVER